MEVVNSVAAARVYEGEESFTRFILLRKEK
jgi:hypothetical protein